MENSKIEKIRYRRKRAEDPAKKIIRRYLDAIIKESGLTHGEIIEKLKVYGVVYTSKKGFESVLERSSLRLYSFVKLMLALGIDSYTIDITEEERKRIKEHEERKY